MNENFTGDLEEIGEGDMDQVFQCPNCGSLVPAGGGKAKCPIGRDLELEIIGSLSQAETDAAAERKED